MQICLQVINYDSTRGGVSVITEKGDVTTSHLLIQNADLADSGKYSCSPSNADVASVRVHVLNGKGSLWNDVPHPSFCTSSPAILSKFNQNTASVCGEEVPKEIPAYLQGVIAHCNSLRENPHVHSSADFLGIFVLILKAVRAIISGEHPEAMQTASIGLSRNWINCVLISLGIIFLANVNFSTSMTIYRARNI